MNPNIWEHVRELRRRLVWSVVFVVIMSIGAYVFSSFFIDKLLFGLLSDQFITFRWLCKLSELISLPSLCWKQQMSFSLINTQVAGQFRYHIILSLVWGVILAFPFVLYQFWLFVKPALYEHEYLTIRRAFFWMFFLFLLGVLFSYFILLPFTLQFLLNYQMSDRIQNMITLDSFFSTVVTLVFWMGVSFELPLLMYVSGKIGLISYQSIKKYRAIVFVVILVIAGIITPSTDIFTQLTVALPLYALFEIGLLLIKKHAKDNFHRGRAKEKG